MYKTRTLYFIIVILMVISRVSILSIKHYIPSNYDMLGHIAFTEVLVKDGHVPVQGVIYAESYGIISSQHIVMAILSLSTSVTLPYIIKIYPVISAILALLLAISLLPSDYHGYKKNSLILYALVIATIMPNFADITGTKLAIPILLAYLYTIYKLAIDKAWRSKVLAIIMGTSLAFTHSVTMIYVLIVSILFIGMRKILHYSRGNNGNYQVDTLGIMFPVITYLMIESYAKNFAIMDVIRDFLEKIYMLLFSEQEVLTITEYYAGFYTMPPIDRITVIILYAGYSLILLVLSLIAMLTIILKKNRNDFETYSLAGFLVSIILFAYVSYFSNLKVRFLYYTFPFLIFMLNNLLNSLNRFIHKAFLNKGKKYTLIIWLILGLTLIISLIGSEGLRIQELVPTYREDGCTKIYSVVIDEATELEHIVALNSLMKLKQLNLLIKTNLPYIVYYSNLYESTYFANLCVMIRTEKLDRRNLFLFIQRTYYAKADFVWEKCLREAYNSGIMSLVFHAKLLKAGIATG
jgi:hypothetical protein